ANLRAIAALYPESVHIVVSREAGIRDLAGLRGKTVSLGERESGTMATARAILRAAGVSETEFKAAFLKPSEAAAALREGRVDAMFEVAAAPSALIADLAQAMDIDLLDISAALAEQLRQSVPYYAPTTIASGAYRGVDDVETASFGTIWVVTSDADD